MRISLIYDGSYLRLVAVLIARETCENRLAVDSIFQMRDVVPLKKEKKEGEDKKRNIEKSPLRRLTWQRDR